MDDQQQPQPQQHQPAPEPHPSEQHRPGFDFTPPASPAGKGGKPLAIALVVSVVLLLAAVGVAIWLMARPAGSTTVNRQTGDGSASVKTVSFVTPATLPAAYIRRDENTHTTQVTYYDDASAMCGLSTAVRPAAADKSPKDVVLAAVAALKDQGTTLTSNTDGSGFKLADTDGSHTYQFDAVVLSQDVAVAGVSFSKQQQLVAYKQFGSFVAAIGYWCKTDSFDAKKAELEPLLQAFKLKTER